MLRLTSITTQKGFETLAESLREQILSGDIPTGEVINERELVERSGLSRGSVREAFRVLETQGLVATRRGRNGGRVAQRTGSDVVASSLDVFIRGQQVPFSVLLETVQALEPALAELAALHRSEADLEALETERRKLATTASPARFLAANARWHRAMAQASHNPILTTIYDALGPGLLDPRVAGFASEEIRAAVVLAATKVQEAIAARDAEAARRRMDRHVRAYRAMVETLAPAVVTL